MKKLTVIILALALLTSCGRYKIDEDIEKRRINVIEIDSCEYIIYCTSTNSGGVCIIHKANCKNHTR